MPSQLFNLRKTLTWRDFGTPRPGPDPAPGAVATAAQMRATHQHTVNGEVVPGTRPPHYRLKDDVTITVVLLPAQIFVNAWVLRQPTSFQDAVLHHEQGHYDMVALFCRDMFIDLMALKSRTFARGADLTSAITGIFRTYDRLIAAVHGPYDTDTRHGRNPEKQQRWDGIIQRAFTQPRNPPVTAPDGTAYKVPLLDCLRGAGITV
jgi:hypothetical protein